MEHMKTKIRITGDYFDGKSYVRWAVDHIL